MISVKVAIAVSLLGFSASTLGVGAYVSSHRAGPLSSPPEVEVARLPPRSPFEFAPANSTGAAHSKEARVLMLEPVLIYGRNFARRDPEPATSSD